MLQTLEFWREQCTQKQLDGFEQELTPLCDKLLAKSLWNKKYDASWHRTLSNPKILETLLYRIASKSSDMLIYREIFEAFAQAEGILPIQRMKKQNKHIDHLIALGIIFQYRKHYCMPVEFVLIYSDDDKNAEHPFAFLKSLTLKILKQIVPQNAQQQLLSTPPSKQDLVAWMVVYAEQHRKEALKGLSQEEWLFLWGLNTDPLDDIRALHKMFPDLTCPNQDTYRADSVLRAALEHHIPKRLKELLLSGVLSIELRTGTYTVCRLLLNHKTKELIQPQFRTLEQKMLGDIKKQWKLDDQNIEPSHASVLREQHKIWQVWVALHFLPLGLTQKSDIRKTDLRKIQKLLPSCDEKAIANILHYMRNVGFMRHVGNAFVAEPMQWLSWSEQHRKLMFRVLAIRYYQSKHIEKDICDILATLPKACWLDLDAVLVYLEIKSKGKSVDWKAFLAEYPHVALHDISLPQHAVYFPDEFHQLILRKKVEWSAPGWYGAKKGANTQGFISASGEIQLPPDFSHKVLRSLVPWCTLTSVEQMVTLQLDEAALKAMVTDKKALTHVRKVLESIQSPLPQAVSYMLDKFNQQKPTAICFGTSMALCLQDAAHYPRVQNLGYTLHQPFEGHPELVLLDVCEDSQAFLDACAKKGILLDMLVPPVSWVEGYWAVKAWMNVPTSRKGMWLEVCYQKSQRGKMQQVYAYLVHDAYAGFGIQIVKYSKKGSSLAASIMWLENKHIVRLRELSEQEISKLDLEDLL